MNKVICFAFVLLLYNCADNSKPENPEKENQIQPEEPKMEEVDGFSPFMEIDRYVKPENLILITYTFKDIIEYKFPADVDFEENVKSSYTSFDKSTVSEGSKYDFHINDYSATEDAIIDSSFTEWVHDQLINYKFENYQDAKMYKTKLLDTDDGVWGFYSCLSYVKEPDTLMMDYLTFGFDSYVVSLFITASPFCENATIVKEYVDGFRLL